MKIKLALTIIALVSASSFSALAAVPTRDQAILNQRTETSAVKVRLLETTGKTGTNAKGIRCAATTGQRGTTRDTTQSITPNGGEGRIRQFDPGIQRAPQTTGTPAGNAAASPAVNPARNAQQRSLMDGTSTVIGGVDTQAAIIPDSQAQYRQMTVGVGTAPTITGALDQNSAVRTQNGITWNQATQSANLLVQALNTANLFNVGQLSASAGGMTTGLPAQSPVGGATCAGGLIGRGTADDPCRPASSACSTIPPGITTDPACVSQRFIDSTGNVSVYLSGVQSSAQSAGVMPVLAASPTSAVPGTDLMTALQTNR